MLNPIKKKIAYKLAMVIVLVVALVSAISIFYFNRINKQNLTDSLYISLSNAIHFSEQVYARPLWDFNDNEIERLNRIVLNNKLIVAVNIFDLDTFMNGTMKERLNGSGSNTAIPWGNSSSIFSSQMTEKSAMKNTDGRQISATRLKSFAGSQSHTMRKLFSPYIPPVNATHIKKIMGNIALDKKEIGHFELFYTEAFIDQAVAMVNRRMIAAFVVIALLISIAIISSVTRINRPIEVLASLTEQVVRENTYDISVTRSKRIDEVGMLVNGFADMMSQIRIKEAESNLLHGELSESLSKFKSLFKTLQNAIDHGDYTLRIQDEKQDDELARSLNKVMRALERADQTTRNQSWIKNGQAELSALIGRERDIKTICTQSIAFIADYVGAKVATLFVKQIEKNRYDLVASFAFTRRKGLEDHFKPGEGLAGQAVVEKKRILFSEVPPGYMEISSSLGYAAPMNIIVLPLLYEANVKGVIELGVNFSFSDIQIELLESLADIVAVAINGALFNEKLSVLLAQTREQAEELRVQQEELKVTNEELEEQAIILKASEEKLQSQQEELRASNEELEEKTTLLQSQKEKIEESNRTLHQKQKEIKDKAEQLALETQYKSEFLANMSHELRTPLNSLLILAEMLADNSENNLTEDQLESAASIHRSGQNLLHLINNILDLSKIEARRVELTLSTFSVKNLGERFKTEFLHMANQKNLDFTVTLADDLPDMITSDLHRLEQIVRNLIGNAIKFTEKGHVELRISRPDHDVDPLNPPMLNLTKASQPDQSVTALMKIEPRIAISVSDSGVGIPPRSQNQIFDAFKQVDGSIRRKHDGTGLGLSISRELARLLDGDILLSSIADEGSTFTLVIPERLSARSNTKTSQPEGHAHGDPGSTPPPRHIRH